MLSAHPRQADLLTMMINETQHLQLSIRFSKANLRDGINNGMLRWRDRDGTGAASRAKSVIGSLWHFAISNKAPDSTIRLLPLVIPASTRFLRECRWRPVISVGVQNFSPKTAMHVLGTPGIEFPRTPRSSLLQARRVYLLCVVMMRHHQGNGSKER